MNVMQYAMARAAIRELKRYADELDDDERYKLLRDIERNRIEYWLDDNRPSI